MTSMAGKHHSGTWEKGPAAGATKTNRARGVQRQARPSRSRTQASAAKQPPPPFGRGMAPRKAAPMPVKQSRLHGGHDCPDQWEAARYNEQQGRRSSSPVGAAAELAAWVRTSSARIVCCAGGWGGSRRKLSLARRWASEQTHRQQSKAVTKPRLQALLHRVQLQPVCAVAPARVPSRTPTTRSKYNYVSIGVGTRTRLQLTLADLWARAPVGLASTEAEGVHGDLRAPQKLPQLCFRKMSAIMRPKKVMLSVRSAAQREGGAPDSTQLENIPNIGCGGMGAATTAHHFTTPSKATNKHTD